MNRRKELKLRSKLAKEIVINMLEMAMREGVDGNIRRAEILGEKARRIAKNFGVKIPKKYKFFYCRKCKKFLIPGKTMRVRIRNNRSSHIVIYCVYCKRYRRIYFK